VLFEATSAPWAGGDVRVFTLIAGLLYKNAHNENSDRCRNRVARLDHRVLAGATVSLAAVAVS
jgi:hypothetical protein